MRETYSFRLAGSADVAAIWELLQAAIVRRQADGSSQWQDGYPNVQTVETDVANGHGYVLTDGDHLVGYCAILIDNEPAYAAIDGKWLTDGSFIVFHRVAISPNYVGQGVAQQLLTHIETFAQDRGIYSLRADTNFDNPAMLRTFDKLGYQYCGEVTFRGSSRKAFEKVLSPA